MPEDREQSGDEPTSITDTDGATAPGFTMLGDAGAVCVNGVCDLPERPD
ncbi:hypothetical protein J8M97_19650 [Gordonia polyisoprenivorans]|nr:hypothetical protein [Gordonia polyisoprenivorans]QUD81945.1 hypothetical protein J8M97_19650 [Gordonia polyisoprenivorans]